MTSTTIDVAPVATWIPIVASAVWIGFLAALLVCTPQLSAWIRHRQAHRQSRRWQAAGHVERRVIRPTNVERRAARHNRWQ